MCGRRREDKEVSRGEGRNEVGERRKPSTVGRKEGKKEGTRARKEGRKEPRLEAKEERKEVE